MTDTLGRWALDTAHCADAQHIPNDNPTFSQPYPTRLTIQDLEALVAQYGAQQGRAGCSGISAKSGRQRVTYAVQLDLLKPDEAALARVFDGLLKRKLFKATVMDAMRTWHRAAEVFG
jgi:hypothetical protein